MSCSTARKSENICDSVTESNSIADSDREKYSISDSAIDSNRIGDCSRDCADTLSAQLSRAAIKLRPCRTVVTRADGRCYVEQRPGDDQVWKSSGNREKRISEFEPVDTCQDCIVEGDCVGKQSKILCAEHMKCQIKTPSEDFSYNGACPGFIIDTKPDLRCSDILPQLLLGSQDVAADDVLLGQHNVTHVLSLLPPGVFEDEYCILSDSGYVVRVNQRIDRSDKSDGTLATTQDLKISEPRLNEGPPDQVIDASASKQVVYAPMLDCPEFSALEMFDSCHKYICSVIGDSRGCCKTLLQRFIASEIMPDNANCTDSIHQNNSKDPLLESNNTRRNVLLVHCNAGVSRAPSVVISYIMAEFGVSYLDARQFVAAKRNFIRPNAGFVEQLKQYEIKLKQTREDIEGN